MPYNKEELLALSDEEKIALAEELWNSVEEKHLPVSDEEIAFAEERLRLHKEDEAEGLSIEEFKSCFKEKHGL